MMLLTLIASPQMEDELVDWLHSHAEITGFTTHVAYGHGSGHQMTIAEQVSGRRQQISFLIALKKALANSIIDELRKHYSGSGLHYWLTPIEQSGQI